MTSFSSNSNISGDILISEAFGMASRDTVDIAYQMLKNALEPQIKTSMMYRANMSFSMLNKYTETLIASDLLTYDGRYYKTTERGRVFIMHYLVLLNLFITGGAAACAIDARKRDEGDHDAG